MTKVELYKSRVFITIIHLCALGQFAYGLYYSNFEVQRSYKLKTSFSRRLVPETLPQKVRFLSYWSLADTTTTIKWHSASAPFVSPAAWVNGYMPCARDLVVFPEYYPAILPLPIDISIAGFELPHVGALLLGADATIHLKSGTALNSECGSDGRAYLKSPKTSKWFDPNSWSIQPIKDSSSSFSPAMPDIDRVPCDDEHVVIMSNSGAISFDLENMEYLRLGQLILAGSSISRDYLQELIRRDLGQLLFHNAQYTTVEYYRGELCGCHKNFEHLVEPVCHNVEQQCEIPHCVLPVRPFGSCCLVCGAIMTLPGQSCVEENRRQLAKFINDAIEKDDLTDELQTHVDFVGSEHYGNLLQAIVIDRNGYSERSVNFMRRLSEQRNQSTLLAHESHLELKFAGHPYNPNVSFGSVLLILFCIVLVGIVSIVILAHFMPENPYLNRIPQWIHDPRHWRWRHLGIRLRRNLLFNRFDNSAAGPGAVGESVADRLAIIAYDAESGEVRERAFNNPMFDQGPEPEPTKAQSQLQSETNVPAPKVETGELNNCSVEEQELTEINLESSDSESDGEAETKE